MCDQATKDIIKAIVDQKVSEEESFTAFDVTKELRAKTGGFIPHREVRGEVSRLFKTGEMANYKSEVGSGYASNVQPLVYQLDFNGNTPTGDELKDDADEPDEPEARKNFWSSIRALLKV